MMFGLLYCDVFWLSLCVFFVALNDNFKAGLLATYLSMHLTNSHPYKNWHKPKCMYLGFRVYWWWQEIHDLEVVSLNPNPKNDIDKSVVGRRGASNNPFVHKHLCITKLEFFPCHVFIKLKHHCCLSMRQCTLKAFVQIFCNHSNVLIPPLGIYWSNFD